MTLDAAQLERQAETVANWLQQWDPHFRPKHCTNCRHAIVSLDHNRDVISRCEMGHGAVRKHAATIRPHNPLSFAPMGKCADFDSMDDADESR